MLRLARNKRPAQQPQFDNPATAPSPPSPPPSFTAQKVASARALGAARDDAQNTLAQLNDRLTHEHADLLHSLAQLKDEDRRANDELREAKTARDAKQKEVEAKEAAVEELVAKLGAEMGSGWVDSLGREKKERPVLPAKMDGVHGSTIKGYITRGTEEAGPSKRRKMRGGRGEDDAVPEACEIGGG